jgi:hypothetical protein
LGSEAKRTDKKSPITPAQVATVLSIIIAIFVASVAVVTKNVLVTAISVGALGGIVHEVAQSSGKVIIPKPDEKSGDVYLGGLFGLIAGGVAGLLVVQGLPDVAPISNSWLSQFFLAGLGLKGFSEAVATKHPK